MRAAVDSSVLLDVLLADAHYAQRSMALLEEYAARGSLVVCPVVFAECAAAFNPTSEFKRVAADMGLVYDEFSTETAILAAQMWQGYRRQGGTRSRIITDFMIGAHAQLEAEVLLTRDRGYYRQYFHGLRVVTP